MTIVRKNVKPNGGQFSTVNVGAVRFNTIYKAFAAPLVPLALQSADCQLARFAVVCLLTLTFFPFTRSLVALAFVTRKRV